MNKEKKLVPELRFPEFSNHPEWEEKELGFLAYRVLLKNNDGAIDSVFTNSAAHGIVDQREYFDKDIANKSNLESYYVVEDGDYVYNPRISTEAPVGPTSKNKTGRTGVMSPLYTVFRFMNKKNQFYEYYFISRHWYDSIRNASNTGARFDRMSITDSKFMEIPVLFPSPKEQQKIASCLSSLDELIAVHREKLEALKDHKKGLMQNLFPQEGQKVPNYRFPEFEKDGEWVDKRLEKTCEVNPRVDELPDEFVYIDLESVSNGLLLKRNIVKKTGAPSRAQRLLQDQDVIYQTVRPYQKNNYYFFDSDGYPYVASTGYAQLRAFDSSSFLFQLIHTDRFVSSILERCTGSNYPAINSSALKQIEVQIPPTKSEQQKIASCLSALDELIKAQSEKIEQLQQHKKGLLQSLFPKTEK